SGLRLASQPSPARQSGPAVADPPGRRGAHRCPAAERAVDLLRGALIEVLRRVAPQLNARDAIWPLVGALLTLVVSFVVVKLGATIGLAAGAILILFL